ncbi:MAG: SET domain-containing protein-lysine N-methyltransferase [Anaerolineales bacterium]
MMAGKKPRFKVRSSPIQGFGVFATQRIPKGTRLIEYTGERITHKEADTRYEDESTNPHVLLFIVDRRTVIDAGVDGNEARFINHSCEPNCEPVIEARRIYIHALRTIRPGEELTYDYSLTREEEDDAATEAKFACRCGASNCRGTMLEPREDVKIGKKTGSKGKRAKRPD